MSKGLDGKSPEAREDFWDRILAEHDDDARLPIQIMDMDGTVTYQGTLSVGGLRETLNNPEYQAMMRRAQERAQEMRERGELPIPDIPPQAPQA